MNAIANTNALNTTHTKTIVKGNTRHTVLHVTPIANSVGALGKGGVQFRELPLLAVFAVRQKKASVLAQKTSNRGYVVLASLKAERADKDLVVHPFDHETAVHGPSESTKFDPKLERQAKKVEQAAVAVKKAELRLSNRKNKLGRLQQPKVKTPKVKVPKAPKPVGSPSKAVAAN